MNISRAPSMISSMPPVQENSMKTTVMNDKSFSFDFDSPHGANEGGGGSLLFRTSSLPEEFIQTLEQIAPPVLQEDGLYDRLMGTLNIRKDPVGCVDLIGMLSSPLLS